MKVTAQAANRPIRVCLVGAPSGLTADLPQALDALRPETEVSWTPTLPPTSTAGFGRDPLAMPPDVLVVLQEHPEHASPALVRALLNAFPLARLVVCCSPWCESDGRTRDLWPAASRVPSDRIVHRLQRELASVRGDSPPLPLTADRDECWEFDFANVPTLCGRSLAVAVCTPDPAVAEWLGDLLPAAGHCIVDPAHSSAEVLLFDADPWIAERAESLAAIQRAGSGPPIVALVGFPRESEQQSLLEAGVRRVVAKLAPLSQLCRALEESADASRPHRPELHIHIQK